MAISRSEMKEYFTNFSIEVDGSENKLNCFKCGYDLNYKSRRYKCVNNHKFRYHQLVMLHADLMNGLVNNVTNKKVCDF